jgi:hypothetical protein
MVVTETDLATEATVVPELRTATALIGFILEILTTSNMLKMIVLSQEFTTCSTFEEPPTTTPNIAIAFNTEYRYVSISHTTVTCVYLETLFTMADPRLAEVTYSTDHILTSCVCSDMFDHAVTAHALDLTALRTHYDLLLLISEITERTILLLTLALLADHIGVTG